MRARETNFSKRLTVYWILQCLALFILLVRLFDIQVLDRKNLKKLALKQFKSEIALPAERGSIVDRRHKILAMNMPSVDVTADPDEVEDKEKAAAQLARLFGYSYSFFYNKLKQKGNFVYLMRQQSPEVREKIEKLNIKGINCKSSLTRKYPKERAACQVVGFSGTEQRGLSGIELACDEYLSGKPGKAVLQKTAMMDQFVRAEYPVISPKNGLDIVLTIDYRFQRIAEAELRNTIVDVDADSGVVVIMNPASGEILALAGEPSFDPNQFGRYHPSTWRLRGVTDQYEPGSTFKVVLMSALLDQNLFTPDDSVFCENGVWEVYGEKIRDTHPYGWLTLRDVLVKSSNIGMAKLAKDTDNIIFYDYAHAFGFGTRPGTELIGETAGLLKHPNEWSGMTPLAMSFGHEVAASAVQMCNLYATIANGGILYQPLILKEIRDNGGVVRSITPRSIRRVIRKETADTLKSFLREAIVRGTGKKAEIDGFDLCGKTGTAKIALSGGRGYGNRYNASFGGFFPKDDPQIAMFVMINNPKRLYYGGDVAAPCFRRIAEQLVISGGLDLDIKGPKPEVETLLAKTGDEPLLPNLRGRSVQTASKLARTVGFDLADAGMDGIILEHHLKGDAVDKELEIVAEAVELVYKSDKPVPKVEGLPIRNALNLLRAHGFEASVSGHGKVVRQEPRPGQKSQSGEVRLIGESASFVKQLVTM